MNARKKVWLLFMIIINAAIIITFILVVLPLFPKDRSFSSLDQISGYLKKRDNVTITRTLDIGEISFIAVVSEDNNYYGSQIIYYKKSKYYLFKATGFNTVLMKSKYGYGFIEINRISNHFVVLVHTIEFDFSGNPLIVSDSDGNSFYQLKITDKSVDFYRVYDKLPQNYIITINNWKTNVN